VLSLYIFSFLDPQSLCHCAQAQIKKQGSVFCKDSLENTEPWGKKESMQKKKKAPGLVWHQRRIMKEIKNCIESEFSNLFLTNCMHFFP